eukprot:jgi/Mesen1/1100/ME000123S00276
MWTRGAWTRARRPRGRRRWWCTWDHARLRRRTRRRRALLLLLLFLLLLQRAATMTTRPPPLRAPSTSCWTSSTLNKGHLRHNRDSHSLRFDSSSNSIVGSVGNLYDGLQLHASCKKVMVRRVQRATEVVV